MFDIIRGLNVPAWLVGFIRGALETAVVVALGAVVLYIADSEFSSEMWAVMLIWGLRTLEGFADQIDPAK